MNLDAVPLPCDDELAELDLSPSPGAPAPRRSSLHPLPSGRVVVLRSGAAGEHLEVRSPEGEIELRVELTPAGPVARVSAARLDLEALDTLALRCREFSLQASEAATLRTGGDLLLQAEGELDLHARGDCRVVANVVFLN